MVSVNGGGVTAFMVLALHLDFSLSYSSSEICGGWSC